MSRIAGRGARAKFLTGALAALVALVPLVGFAGSAGARSGDDSSATAALVERLESSRAPHVSQSAPSAGAGVESAASRAASGAAQALSPAVLSSAADPAGDAASSRGDIVFAGLSLSSDSVFVALSTDVFSTPGTTPWTVGTTGIIWELDTNGDAVSDYNVFYLAPSGAPVLLVTREGSTATVCTGNPSFDAASSTYYGTFAPSCIGNPARSWWWAYMAFTDLGVLSQDAVPDIGWAGPSNRESALPLPSGAPIGSVDTASAGLGTIRVAGWTIDPDSASSIAAHVYIDGKFAGAVDADRPRNDLTATFPAYGPAHGYDLTTSAAGGAHDVCVYGINVGGGVNSLLGCRSVTVPTGPPIGGIDLASAGLGTIRVAGWTIDPDSASSIAVHVYVDSALVGVNADRARGDLVSAFPGYGAAHGFDVTAPATGGAHNVCVYGINIGGGSNSLIGCRAVTVPGGPPIGGIDVATGGLGTVHVAGWALDPDSANSIAVHVYVDGALVGVIADRARGDLLSAFPGYGAAHGFDVKVAAEGGVHNVCVYGIDIGGGGNSLLGCRSITVPTGAPIGGIDLVSASAGSVRVAGWALDPDSSNSIAVHVYVDGALHGVNADRARGDLLSAFPGYGAAHGFDVAVAASSGAHNVCVYGINVGGGSNSLIGCRAVTVP